MSTSSYLQTAPQFITQFFKQFHDDLPEIYQQWIELLVKAWQEGHSFITLTEDECKIAKQLPTIIGTINDNTPLILIKQHLSFAKIVYLEKLITTRFLQLSKQQQKHTDHSKIQQYLDLMFLEEHNTDQKQAVALSLLNHLTVIMGGPGTGKTTTVAKLLSIKCLLSPSPMQIALTAPTGKAAMHLHYSLSQALSKLKIDDQIKKYLLNLQGQTLHKLLKIHPPLMNSPFNQNNPIDFDVIIIDESSMIDLSLMAKLTNAISSKTHLILLGDANQLQAVGGGAILSSIQRPTILTPTENQSFSQWIQQHEITIHDAPPPLSSSIATLHKSHRFGINSGIGRLANAILTEQEDIEAIFTAFPQELSFISQRPIMSQDWYKTQKSYWNAIDQKQLNQAFLHFYDGIVLTALNEDTENFNKQYLHFLHNQRGVNQFFPGLPIMITQNDVNSSLFNGDIGIFFSDDKTGKLKVFFQNGHTMRAINISQLPRYKYAFALTVHKSQGSEYQNVCFIAPSSQDNNKRIVDKTLLYTALTRAKKHFSYFGSLHSFLTAMHYIDNRKSQLSYFLEKNN